MYLRNRGQGMTVQIRELSEPRVRTSSGRWRALYRRAAMGSRRLGYPTAEPPWQVVVELVQRIRGCLQPAENDRATVIAEMGNTSGEWFAVAYA
jgi:hypothetical protein